MNPYWGYILLGYLMGGILFASLIPRALHHLDVTEDTEDGNPGTFNAFVRCGVPTGILVLVCELGKAFLPVWAASRRLAMTDPRFALVLMAPVLGHVFPLLHHFKGGKGIAASFGVLLALTPDWRPVLTLALCYILFSTAVRVETHLWRSVVTYGAFALLAFSHFAPIPVRDGSVLIAATVILGHLLRRVDAESFSVHLLRRRAD